MCNSIYGAMNKHDKLTVQLNRRGNLLSTRHQKQKFATAFFGISEVLDMDVHEEKKKKKKTTRDLVHRPVGCDQHSNFYLRI